MPNLNIHRAKILAVASGGGHWTQLLRLRPAFEGYDVCYVTTLRDSEAMVSGAKMCVVRDASRKDAFGVIVLIFQLIWLIIRQNPEIIISTGAAPGLIALHIGKLLGAHTIWIDSIANVEKLSMSGMLAKRCADLWLTQWPHLVPKYSGLSCMGDIL